MKKRNPDVCFFFDTYYIVDHQLQNVIPLKEISEMEYNEIMSSNNVLYEFKYYQRRYRQVQLNYDDFFKIFSDYQSKIFSNPPKKEVIFEDARIDINRVFENFISSFKLLMDQVEGRLKSKYGKKSKEYIGYKKYIKGLYENNFEYRLLYELRNYSQHVNFPIDKFHSDIDYDQKSQIISIKNFTAMIDKKVILLDNTIRKKLKSDLNLYADSFDILPIISKFYNLCDNFLQTIIKIEDEYFHPHVKQIINISESYNFNGKLSIGKCRVMRNQMGQWDTYDIPINIALDYNNYLKNIKL